MNFNLYGKTIAGIRLFSGKTACGGTPGQGFQGKYDPSPRGRGVEIFT